MRLWLFFASAVLLGWGIYRVKTGEDSGRVGQETIGFVVGIVGVTFALLALLPHG